MNTFADAFKRAQAEEMAHLEAAHKRATERYLATVKTGTAEEIADATIAIADAKSHLAFAREVRSRQQ